MQAHDVADLDLEPWVARDLEASSPGAARGRSPRDAAHGGHGHPHLLRQRPHRPVPCVCWRRRHREVDRCLHPVLRNRLLPGRARGVPKKTVDALREETVPPVPHRRLRHARPPNRSIRLCPEPSARTMRARQACFWRLRGWPATRSRRPRSPSESPVSRLVGRNALENEPKRCMLNWQYCYEITTSEIMGNLIWEFQKN